MRRDWYAELIDRHRDGVRRSRDLTQQRLAAGWYRFFEEASLYTTYAEATSGPKQDIRDIYMKEMGPKKKQPYKVAAQGLGLMEKLALDMTPKALMSGLENFPTYSWAIYFRFRLAKPYLSKDEAPFYVIDNPVRKEKIFKLPMVAATTWKGNLRAVLRQEQKIMTAEAEREHEALLGLFGNAKGEEEQEKFRAGRLRFFPTLFTEMDLDVINPHSRESGAGEQPIYLECVPSNAEGTFALLYTPFDLLAKPQKEVQRAVAQDLTLAAKGVRALMLRYGVGAKTSSGFGVARNRVIDGQLGIRTAATAQAFPFPSLTEMLKLALAMAQHISPGGGK